MKLTKDGLKIKLFIAGMSLLKGWLLKGSLLIYSEVSTYMWEWQASPMLNFVCCTTTLRFEFSFFES
jgi:hypothetical protein